MKQSDSNFLKRLRTIFITEAEEHLSAVSNGLVELENISDEKTINDKLEVIFREVHSLKGAARSVNLVEFEKLCQSIENVFAALKRKDIELNTPMFDALHSAVDFLNGNLATIKKDTEVKELPSTEFVNNLENLLKSLSKRNGKKAKQVNAPVEPTLSPDIKAQANTLRISTAKLDSIFYQVEELLTIKLISSQRASELVKLKDELTGLRKNLSRTESTDTGALLNIENELMTLSGQIKHDERSFGSLIDNLLDEMKQTLLQPFSSILDFIPKFIRDLSRKQGKTVELKIAGSDIEIDKRILDEMRDPLIHLVRNCIDHGIEKPQIRKENKKPQKGIISIIISQEESSRIALTIKDDGGGIDKEVVKKIALKNGMVSEEELRKLDDDEVMKLIFQSGLTTSTLITDISGRGLGLAIVKESVEKLNGIININSEPGKGTEFNILLPLTLSTFRGVLIKVNDEIFTIPTLNIERIVRAKPETIATVENRETFKYDDSVVPVVRMQTILEMPFTNSKSGNNNGAALVVLVLASAEKKIAFIVDEVLEEQEILVKNLGKQLKRVRNVMGTTILGSGKVVPILNTLDLIKSALKTDIVKTEAADEAGTETQTKSILVAEDSITSRSLLKNILESAGYIVNTAVDGAEAFSLLHTDDFDLVVSDIDMPRLNGFELVQKIRSDKKLSELPVVLVTALESREDKERGIEVGANAYIIKSSFDQSNLLEVIERLI